jgi:hypothetical protein
MKILKRILLFAALFSFTTSNAQFWKKLKKKAAKAIENTVVRKVEEKSEKETDKAFDSVFNNNGKLFKGKKIKVAERYTFTHQYNMEIKVGNGKKDITEITYYLTNDYEYMGSTFNSGRKNQEFISVVDLPNNAVHTFMNLGNQKSRTSFNFNSEDADENEKNVSKFQINSTGQTKKIVGYLCEEYQITGPQLSGKVWVTQYADISFHKAFTQLKSKKMKKVKGVDQSWLSMVDGLVLEMKMVDNSKRKPKPITMRCTSLSKKDFSIETATYQKQF